MQGPDFGCTAAPRRCHTRPCRFGGTASSMLVGEVPELAVAKCSRSSSRILPADDIKATSIAAEYKTHPRRQDCRTRAYCLGGFVLKSSSYIPNVDRLLLTEMKSQLQQSRTDSSRRKTCFSVKQSLADLPCRSIALIRHRHHNPDFSWLELS
ncbi:hypothetical protein EV356DRAFT_232259 [Viridothelium virens]|uniref:Uncharacterized protein n=1 Tax=Viridothelium virens TaxID=1048519 RepID=A0A6A6H4T2_VIRVR|nr:hypothetical protein EV356DRAFT_232259 [Viridothelium virens]